MDKEIRILIVDDEKITLRNLEHILKKEGYTVKTTTSGQNALRLLNREIYDLVLTDLKMERVDGMQILKRTKEISPDTEVIMITGYATVETAIEAIRQGAYHYLPKPVNVAELKVLVGKALEKSAMQKEIRSLKKQLSDNAGASRIIGQSPAVQAMRERITQVAQLDCNVLILGETGTGKELVARTIHELSPRSKGRFVAFNCGAFTEELITNELFGHEKEAFTGANREKKGLLELAEGGTVFFDEIGELPLDVQPKLNLFLDTGRFYPVGSQKEVSVDVRIIAATNREEHELREGKNFRSDLYYRLSTIVIKIPPLRKRPEDIWPLAQYFFDKYKHFNRGVKGLHPLTKPLLEQYHWPGNVRELENFISRLIIMTEGDFIDKNDVRAGLSEILFRDEPSHLSKKNVLLPLQEARAEFERDYILFILKNVGNSRTKAAEVLGIDRVHLQRKLKQLKINTL